MGQGLQRGDRMVLDLTVFLSFCAVPLLMLMLLPLLRHDAWWVRGFEFPAVQITVVTCAALIDYPVIFGWPVI